MKTIPIPSSGWTASAGRTRARAPSLVKTNSLMKVVRIIARLNVGGPARHVIWLTEGLRRAACDTLLVTGSVPPGEDDMSYFAAERQIEPHLIAEMSREISPKDAFVVWKLYRLMVRERPDIVHTHTAKAGTVGRVAGLLYRYLTPGALIGRPRACRFVHTYHGHIFHSYYGSLKTGLFLRIEKVLARVVTDKIIAISPQQYLEIHERFGVGRAGQFRVIPLGLETSAFAGWRQKRVVLREELGLGERDCLVGIVGRLTEIKNHELFLRAVAGYKRAYGSVQGLPRTLFAIIGDGNLRASLEDEARALGLGEDVLFLGTRNDPENFYPALDIVALTSRNEGTPLTLIEAMANARPIVATAVGGVRDLLGEKIDLESEGAAQKTEDGFRVCERGILVPSGDAEGFSRALQFLVLDEKLRGEMAARAEKYVAEHYSKERLLKDIAALYCELAKQQTTAPESAPAGVWELKKTEGVNHD